jgi:hypothetical protein
VVLAKVDKFRHVCTRCGQWSISKDMDQHLDGHWYCRACYQAVLKAMCETPPSSMLLCPHCQQPAYTGDMCLHCGWAE